MSNPLVDIIPVKARKYLYAAFAAACLAVGSLQVAGVNVGHAPDVLTYIGAGIGATASSNAILGKALQQRGYGDGV